MAQEREPKNGIRGGRREDISIGRYENVVTCDLEVPLLTQGRILDLSLRLGDVCPGRRTAVAVLVYELDPAGREYPRGLRTLLVPAHEGTQSQDVQLQNICFVLPEELDVSGRPGGDIGNQRRLRVRVFAHPVDVEYTNTPAQQ